MGMPTLPMAHTPILLMLLEFTVTQPPPMHTLDTLDLDTPEFTILAKDLLTVKPKPIQMLTTVIPLMVTQDTDVHMVLDTVLDMVTVLIMVLDTDMVDTLTESKVFNLLNYWYIDNENTF